MAKVSGGYRTSSTDERWNIYHHNEDNHCNHHNHHNWHCYSINDVGRMGSVVFSDHFFLQVVCRTDNYVNDWCTCVFGGDGCHLSTVAVLEEVHFLHCIGCWRIFREFREKSPSANDIAVPSPTPQILHSQSSSQLPMRSEK